MRFQRYLLPLVLLGLIISLLLPRPEEPSPAPVAVPPEAEMQTVPDPRSYRPRPEPVHGLSDADRRQLGFGARPERRILQSLSERRDLIPQQPVLGGSMDFVLEESVVLNRHWVLAVYEDGHVRGQALFEYQVSEAGEISWKLLTHRPD